MLDQQMLSKIGMIKLATKDCVLKSSSFCYTIAKVLELFFP